jgi:hypothetical protein
VRHVHGMRPAPWQATALMTGASPPPRGLGLPPRMPVPRRLQEGQPPAAGQHMGRATSLRPSHRIGSGLFPSVLRRCIPRSVPEADEKGMWDESRTCFPELEANRHPRGASSWGSWLFLRLVAHSCSRIFRRGRTGSLDNSPPYGTGIPGATNEARRHLTSLPARERGYSEQRSHRYGSYDHTPDRRTGLIARGFWH